jgi:hypothetical protein
MSTVVRSAVLLVLIAGCGGTPKATVPVDSPLRPFAPPEEEASPSPGQARPPEASPAAPVPAPTPAPAPGK